MMVINSLNVLALFLQLNNGNVQTCYVSSADQGCVQIHILELNTNTTRPNQIQIKYIAFPDFNSNTNTKKFQFKYKYKYTAIFIQIRLKYIAIFEILFIQQVTAGFFEAHSL